MNKKLMNWMLLPLTGVFCLVQPTITETQRTRAFIDDEPFVQDYSIKTM